MCAANCGPECGTSLYWPLTPSCRKSCTLLLVTSNYFKTCMLHSSLNSACALCIQLLYFLVLKTWCSAGQAPDDKGPRQHTEVVLAAGGLQLDSFCPDSSYPVVLRSEVGVSPQGHSPLAPGFTAALKVTHCRLVDQRLSPFCCGLSPKLAWAQCKCQVQVNNHTGTSQCQQDKNRHVKCRKLHDPFHDLSTRQTQG